MLFAYKEIVIDIDSAKEDATDYISMLMQNRIAELSLLSRHLVYVHTNVY